MNLFVKGVVYLSVKGELTKIPIFGNFCPNCNNSSDNIHNVNGILNCRKCDYIFTVNDMKKSLAEFWSNHGI